MIGRLMLGAFGAVLLLTPPLPGGARENAPLTVAVDLRDAPRSVLHAHLTIPAAAGPLTLAYPKWIPGEHMPSGPIANLAGIVVRANGSVIPWRRDDVDGYAFHLDVPATTRALAVDVDFLLGRGGDFSAGASSTPSLAVLNWNQVLLLPKPYRLHDVRITPSVVLPPGWSFATALTGGARRGDRVSFPTTTVERLVDSPLETGRHARVVPLWSAGGATAELDLFGDSAASIDVPPATIAAYRRLVPEAISAFGSRHFQHYHFLTALSDNVTSFGLEHHESSDDRIGERYLIDPDARLTAASLLPHELTHSWNGKFRRPAGLATAEYAAPMHDELLWVYEGLTNYYGDVLTARSGLYSLADFTAVLAIDYASLDATPGRTTRSLDDTAVFAPTLYAAPDWGTAQRRSVDFYEEGTLLWLDADTLIRTRSHGTRSLDDVMHRFVGIANGAVEVRPYVRADVIAALSAVAPYDWAGFFRARVDVPTAHPPSPFARAGWRLVFTARPTAFAAAEERLKPTFDLRYSLGAIVAVDGTVKDVLFGSPAWRAGLSWGQRILAIGGRTWSRTAAADAMTVARRTRVPIEVIVDDLADVRTLSVAYTGGPRYARLVRIPGTRDLLAAIARPRTGAPRR